MQRLKELRLSRRYSQAELAEMLKTTQQTIERWETGKSEPNIAALRDLSLIFATSVDDLLGENPLSDKVTTTDWFGIIKDSGQDGYWGNLGILLPGQAMTRWYPVTLGTVQAFAHCLSDLKETDWLCVKTLNNRMLAINPLKLGRIWLLDEGSDAPEEDWDVGWDTVQGNPLELYKALFDYFVHPDDLRANSSEDFISIVERTIKDNGFDEDQIFKMTHYTTVYLADGRLASYWAEKAGLWDLIWSVENNDVPLLITLPDGSEDFESYYPSNNIAMVDMPLLEVMEAAKDEFGDLEAAAASMEYERILTLLPGKKQKKKVGERKSTVKAAISEEELFEKRTKHPRYGEWYDLTKDQVESLVWSMPTTQIANDFGISDVAVGKRCRKEGIKKPSPGFWAKVAAGKIPHPQGKPSN